MMKKIFLLAVLLLGIIQVCVSAQTDENNYVYLPIVTKNYCQIKEPDMSSGESWFIVVPEATTNFVLNPSGEIAGNFAAEGGATATRVTTDQKYGLYSYRVQTAANNDGINFTLSALQNTANYVTMAAANRLPPRWRWSLNGTAWITPEKLQSINADWGLYGAEFPAAQANGSTTLYVEQDGAGSGDFNLDGVQVENKAYWTTYCDGEQNGCVWNGTINASTSSRSAQSRAGGKLSGLYEDFGFFVERAVGTGTTGLSLGIDSYALLPGGELNNIKVQSRTFQLIGKFFGITEYDLHRNRQMLIEALSKDNVPPDDKGYQPILIRFTGAEVEKEIEVHYQSGLEGDLEAYYCNYSPSDDEWKKHYVYDEQTQIQFAAPDPYWYEVGNSAIALDAEDSATFYTIAGRLRDSGRWSNLGPPDALGTYTEVRALKWAPTGQVLYIGGEFANWDNIALADFVVSYDPNTDTYAAISATALTERVYALGFLADGTLILGGRFQNAGGDADADYVCQYDGANFSAISATVLNNYVRALALAPDGNLYIGGDFTNVGGDADADYVVYWDGTNFNTMGATPLNGIVRAIAVGIDGTVYIGGEFTNAGGDADADYICKWDGSSFSALTGTPLNGIVHAIDIGPDGIVYIGGEFTDAGGDTNADYICRYNQLEFSSMGSGVDDDVRSIGVGYDNVIWVSGAFETAGGISAIKNAKWNGSSWYALEIDPGIGSGILAYAIEFGRKDPLDITNYDVFWGFDDTSTLTYAGAATATNDGTAISFPRIYINRAGGTSAVVKFLRNESRNFQLNFNDYGLLDGETLTIDLAPTILTVTSDILGDRPDALLTNSDFGSFSLGQNDNLITMYVDNTGATITTWMQWRTPYISWD